MNNIQNLYERAIKNLGITKRVGIALGILFVGALIAPGGAAQAAIIYSYTPPSFPSTHSEATSNSRWAYSSGATYIIIPDDLSGETIASVRVRAASSGGFTGGYIYNICIFDVNTSSTRDCSSNPGGPSNTLSPSANPSTNLAGTPPGEFEEFDMTVPYTVPTLGTGEYVRIQLQPEGNYIGFYGADWSLGVYGDYATVDTYGLPLEVGGAGSVIPEVEISNDGSFVPDPGIYGILDYFPLTATVATTSEPITFSTTIRLSQDWIDAAMTPGAGGCGGSSCGEFRLFWSRIRNIDHLNASVNETLQEELVQGTFWGSTIATTTSEQTFTWGPYDLPDGTYTARIQLTSNKGFGAVLDEQEVVFQIGDSDFVIGSTLEEVLNQTASSTPSGNALYDGILVPIWEGLKYKFPWGFFFLVKEELEAENAETLGNLTLTYAPENSYFGGLTLTIVDWSHLDDMLDSTILDAINAVFAVIVWGTFVWWGVNFGRRVMGTIGEGGAMKEFDSKMN